MMDDSGKVGGSSFIDALVNEYIGSSTRTSGEFVTGFIEQMCQMYNGGTNTVKGQVKSDKGVETITLLEVKDKSPEWQKFRYYSSKRNFSDITLKNEIEASGNRVIESSGTSYNGFYISVFC